MPHSDFPTAFGPCALSWNDAGLTGFRLPDMSAAGAGARPDAPGAVLDVADRPEWVRRLIVRVQAHLAGSMQDFSDTPLDWSLVSEFQRAVYLHAQAIRPGSTQSYGDIARALARGSEGARSIGTALAANPWPLIVPCHRVVAADGRMTGFSASGGVRTKARLLALEGAELLAE